MSRIYAAIRRAAIDEGTVEVPEGMKASQIQSWAHTIAERMGLSVVTRSYPRNGRTYVLIVRL